MLFVDLTNQDINKLIDFIYTNFDINFKGYAKASFIRRITNIINILNFNSIDELINWINESNIEWVVNNITVNTTEFFRDNSLFKSLHTLYKEFNTGLDIWHVACSTGEEIISNNILLNEFNILETSSIIGTDINNNVLDIAKNAKYYKRYYNNLIQNFNLTEINTNIAKYFAINAEHIEFDKNLIKNVKYINHNVSTDKKIGSFDIIFCRNILIYFSQSLQNKVINKLYNSLKPNGVLVLGSKESLYWSDKKEKFKVRDEWNRIYQKIN